MDTVTSISRNSQLRISTATNESMPYSDMGLSLLSSSVGRRTRAEILAIIQLEIASAASEIDLAAFRISRGFAL